MLHLEGPQAVLQTFEDRGIGYFKLKESARLKRGVDMVHVHSCEVPEEALAALTPGGIVVVEGLTCTQDKAQFGRFMDMARRVGAVAIGRRIAVIVKSGQYRPDKERVSDAASSGAVLSDQQDEDDGGDGDEGDPERDPEDEV